MEHAGEEQPGPSTRSDNIWQHVNTANIATVPINEQDQAIQHMLDVNVFDQRAFEEGMIGQMEEAANRRESVLQKKRARADIKIVFKEISILTSEIQKLEKVIKNFESTKNTNEDNDFRKRILSVKNQKTIQKQSLKKLNAKLKRLKRILEIPENAVVMPTSEITEDDTDSAIKWVLSGKTEDEREKLIKQGLMTPFGTFINKEEKIEPRIRKVFLDDGGFNDYLSSQTAQQKKFKKEKVKKTESQKNVASEKEKAAKPKKTSYKDFTHKPPAYKTTYNNEDEEDYKIESDSSDDESPAKKTKITNNKVQDDSDATQYRNRIIKYKKESSEPFEDKIIDNNFKVPGFIWSKLFRYQKTGLRWLLELHAQQAGGILGDEMGLGKTIQVIASLAAIKVSRCRDSSVPGKIFDGLGPVLIVCPTTVIQQWVSEFHKWWPEFRVAIFHNSGNFNGKRSQLIDRIASTNGVLVTSYSRARLSIDALLTHAWHYVILDEGHKIRNPNAAVTNALKLFPTPHRIILSGSPVQNNLRELWSLFDFVFPGKLGTLPVFLEHFSVPILQGGYANATEVQVHTAYKCACKLRDTISPYLLRRMKCDVSQNINLPNKSEQVLFCKLSAHQVDVYKQYLDSDSVDSILKGSMKIFSGLIQLRKICNHPDLYTGGPKLLRGEEAPTAGSEECFGFYRRSGKMIVVRSLLDIWFKQKRRVLLFTQSKMMLGILESFVKHEKYSYITMDGGTPVGQRQPLIQKFNSDDSIFIFILTTRVGGLGVNLTGANRVVIFDPDWNPSTDSQAQERAWRIGQLQDVTIYRLLTSGTIEEKIYHRQIFKQFLTNRVLKDPRQRRFFKANDMHELFTLGDQGNNENDHKNKASKEMRTETSAIFAGTGSEVNIKLTKSKKKKSRSNEKKQFVETNRMPKRLRSEIFEERIENSSTTSTIVNPLVETTNAVPSTTNLVKSITDNPLLNTTGIAGSSENLLINNSSSSTEISKVGGESASTATNEAIANEAATAENSAIANVSAHSAVLGGDNPEITTAANCTENKTSSSGVEPYEGALTNKSVNNLKESFRKAKLRFLMEKESQKKKSKKKRKLVDGEEVSNIVSMKTESRKIEEFKQSRRNTDEYVLEKLFKNAGVHSALKHDVIMKSSNPDYSIVEVEAERVAKEAVRNLKLSRQSYNYPIRRKRPKFGSSQTKKLGTTGIENQDSNDASAFDGSQFKFIDNPLSTTSSSATSDDVPPGPISAASLLSTMRKRNHFAIHQLEEEEDDETEEPSFEVGGANGFMKHPTTHDQLLQDIRDFLCFQSEVTGQASTGEIMSQFKDKIENEDAAIFKSLLQNICNVTKKENGENMWRLKPEFR